MTSRVNNIPNLKLEIAWDINALTDPLSTDWVEIDSSKIISGALDEGRSHDINSIKASTLRLRLKDEDRLFDTCYNASVRPWTHIRLKTFWDGTWYNTFRGYIITFKVIESNKWASNYCEVDIECEDALSLLNKIRLKSNWEYEVLDGVTEPYLWYPLGEQSGTVLTNRGSAGDEYNGIYRNGSTFYKTTSLVDDNQNTAIKFVDESHYADVINKHLTAPNNHFSIACWVQLNNIRDWPSTNEDEKYYHIFHDRLGNSAIQLFFIAELNTSNDQHSERTDFKLHGYSFDNQNEDRHIIYTFTNAEIDELEGKPKFIVFTQKWDKEEANYVVKLYVDGVEVASSNSDLGVTYTSSSQPNGISIGKVDRYDVTYSVIDTFDYRFFETEFILDELLGYKSTLSAAKVLALYNAGSDAWGTELLEDRFDIILDKVSWPSALRDLPTTTQNVGSMNTEDKTVFSVLAGLAECYSSLLFCSRDGKISFVENSQLHTLSKYIDTFYTFNLNDIEKHYIEFDREDYNDKYIFNKIVVTAKDRSKAIVTSQDSIDKYGEKTLPITSAGGYEDALVVGKGILARRNEPRPVMNITLYPEADPEEYWPLVLGIELHQIIELNRHKSKGLEEVKQDWSVQRIKHKFKPDDVWETIFTVTPPDSRMFDWWTCGETKLGELRPGWPI